MSCNQRGSVRREVFRGAENRGGHRRGAELAALAVLTTAVAAYCLYLRWTNLATGLLLGMRRCCSCSCVWWQRWLFWRGCLVVLLRPRCTRIATVATPPHPPPPPFYQNATKQTGVAGAWIGVTIQHCGNHGAMSTSPAVNLALGLTNDLIGGASLTWRYHHQVSHHVHTNDEVLDEDVRSMYPLLRFDPRLPRRWCAVVVGVCGEAVAVCLLCVLCVVLPTQQTSSSFSSLRTTTKTNQSNEPNQNRWHRWQHLYIWVAYPALHVAFQLGDFASLVTGRTVGAELVGAAPLGEALVGCGGGGL
jgi:hypothetical protein